MMQGKRNVNLKKRNILSEERGVALFAALAFLLIFSMLGTAYVRYMSTAFEESREVLQNIRADHLSRGGIYAAIGEIQSSLEKGVAPSSKYAVELPVRRMVQGEEIEFPQTVEIRVIDESGKVNLNSAPQNLLAELGIPQATSFKFQGVPSKKNKRPLASVDELRTGDFMSGQNFNALDKSLFTVYTGTSKQVMVPVNINSASTAILAAIFSIDAEEAVALAEKRPFTSWSDVLQKVGREPSTFALKSSSGSMPATFTLNTRTFRLYSEARMKTTGSSRRGRFTSVEAVVHFADDGSFSIRYWNESGRDEAPAEEEIIVAVEVTPGDDEAALEETSDKSE